MNALDRAYLALNGLSVGDAFGEQFFVDPDEAQAQIEERRLPAPPWTYTDDTEMALSVLAVLRDHDGIEQDALAQSFAVHYDPQRGYGPTTRGLLAHIRDGGLWEVAARSLFGGAGSQGNGAAMRVAPIGGYFADDLEAAVHHARLSAEVTHQHPEGIAGAIAVAVAAALAWQLCNESSLAHGRAFLNRVMPHVPDSLVREKIRHARNLQEGASVRLAVAALGNGTGLSAPDTVSIALWWRAHKSPPAWVMDRANFPLCYQSSAFFCLFAALFGFIREVKRSCKFSLCGGQRCKKYQDKNVYKIQRYDGSPVKSLNRTS